MPVIQTIPGVNRYELRNGVPGFKWRGMRTNGQPGAVDPNVLRMLVNGRLIDGDVHERPGWTTFNGTPYQDDSCIRLISDYQIQTPKRMWIVGDGCPGLSSSVGFYVGHFDEEQSPDFQTGSYYDGSSGVGSGTDNVAVAFFGGELYVGVDNQLRTGRSSSASGTPQDTPLYTFYGYTIRCMYVFDAKLFISLDAGAGASKIATFDGVSVRDEVTGIDPVTCFGSYHVPLGGNAIVRGSNTAPYTAYYRGTGDSPGTWTAIGAMQAFGQNSMASLSDVFYVADGSTNIRSWDGTTVATAHTIAGASIYALTKFANRLYFGYTASGHGLIGQYDGSIATDVEKDMTAQFGNCAGIRVLTGYRDRLVAGGVTSPNTGGRLYFSPGLLTTGTWIEVDPTTTSFNGDFDQLMVA